MPTLTLTEERTAEEAFDHPEPAAAPPPSRRQPGPVAAMVAGLLVIALAAGIGIGAQTDNSSDGPADPTAITVSARDISVVTQVYGPGEDSGWHAHSGIHAVSVLSGTLTVYDGQCQRTTYEAGRPYVGGQQAHLVRNEGEAPVVMAVTYLSPSAANETTRTLPAPAGC